jgi:endo-1,4-beta-mannosidase
MQAAAWLQHGGGCTMCFSFAGRIATLSRPPLPKVGEMIKRILCSSFLFCLVAFATHLGAQASSTIVILDEPNFPAIDTAPVPTALLHQAFPSAIFSPAAELNRHLSAQPTGLLVLPYGSAFPLDQWPAIKEFLAHGGNLLTLGGRPFTRPARFENGKWQLLPETYAFARELLISDYQETPGSLHLASILNKDEAVADYSLLQWQRAYSMVIRLSQQETSTRVGASGSFDSQLKTLLWRTSGGNRVAAPIVEIDHYQNQFAGGRWVMVNAQIDKAFLESSGAVAFLEGLAKQATNGAELLRVTPQYALFLPGEEWQFELEWSRFQKPPESSRMSIVISREGQPEAKQTIDLGKYSHQGVTTFTLPSSGRPGFYRVHVQMSCGADKCGSYHTAFWVRDEAYLHSGPAVTVDKNYFRIDGKPIEVIGTTYMASDAQRLYFRYPNPYVWDEDMKQMEDAGINMLRTGLWTDWDKVTGDTGVASERTRRTMEAFLMTARKHGLPVQFNLFAFMPEVFGGVNPYLDPVAVQKQQKFVASMVQPFARVPFLIWDVINEPSFDNPKRFFATHPNGDAAETAAWNNWLLHKYGSRGAIESAWKASFPEGSIPPPNDQDMSAQSASDGGHPLAIYDFSIFAQDSFAAWADKMRQTIRDTGSQQLITIGQDEGGALFSPSPSFFKKSVDFSTMHSWWMNDDLLWDSLAVRQSGMPTLVQETGVIAEIGPNGRPRRTPQADGALLEKKFGIAAATGAGAIEWLWNVNALMRSQQEITIGAVRPDGTEKPDAQVLRAYANFAKAIQDRLSEPTLEEVTILTSQSAQFSVLGGLAIDAQRRAVRAMNYACHISARMVSENNIDDIEGSKLVILPSAQLLQDASWQSLMTYVDKGGNLLLTGPVERDEHWEPRNRLRQLGIDAATATLDYRNTTVNIGVEHIEAAFASAAQRALETLVLPDGRSYMEVKHGKGTIFIVAAPVELAESPSSASAVYRHVLSTIGIAPEFEAVRLPPGVLVRTEIMKDSLLYLFVSESSRNEDIDLRDKLTGAHLKLTLPALRTNLLLLDRPTGAVHASYLGPEWLAN